MAYYRFVRAFYCRSTNSSGSWMNSILYMCWKMPTTSAALVTDRIPIGIVCVCVCVYCCRRNHMLFVQRLCRDMCDVFPDSTINEHNRSNQRERCHQLNMRAVDWRVRSFANVVGWFISQYRNRKFPTKNQRDRERGHETSVGNEVDFLESSAVSILNAIAAKLETVILPPNVRWRLQITRCGHRAVPPHTVKNNFIMFAWAQKFSRPTENYVQLVHQTWRAMCSDCGLHGNSHRISAAEPNGSAVVFRCVSIFFGSAFFWPFSTLTPSSGVVVVVVVAFDVTAYNNPPTRLAVASRERVFG